MKKLSEAGLLYYFVLFFQLVKAGKYSLSNIAMLLWLETKSMIDTVIWGHPRGLGYQWKRAFISAVQGNKGQILRVKGEKKTILGNIEHKKIKTWGTGEQTKLFQGNKRTGTAPPPPPKVVWGPKGKFWVSFVRKAMALFYTIYASKGGRLWQVCTFALSCLGLRHKWRLNAILCEQRRLWRVCTFAQAYLSLRHCTKPHVLP